MAFILLITAIPVSAISVGANSTNSYIIVTNSRRSMRNIENQIDEEAIENNEILAENNILIADLTSREKRELE